VTKQKRAYVHTTYSKEASLFGKVARKIAQNVHGPIMFGQN
jgi:hypothetical protein